MVHVYMPPKGYTNLTISRETQQKLIDVMELEGLESPPEALRYVVNEHLAAEDELRIQDLAEMIASRAGGGDGH